MIYLLSHFSISLLFFSKKGEKGEAKLSLNFGLSFLCLRRRVSGVCLLFGVGTHPEGRKSFFPISTLYSKMYSNRRAKRMLSAGNAIPVTPVLILRPL